jgi:hypothetical protein
MLSQQAGIFRVQFTVVVLNFYGTFIPEFFLKRLCVSPLYSNTTGIFLRGNSLKHVVLLFYLILNVFEKKFLSDCSNI